MSERSAAEWARLVEKAHRAITFGERDMSPGEVTALQDIVAILRDPARLQRLALGDGEIREMWVEESSLYHTRPPFAVDFVGEPYGDASRVLVFIPKEPAK